MAKQGELDVSHLLAEGASNHHLARAQTAECSLSGRSHQARKRCDEVGSLSTSRTGKRPALSVSDTSLAFPHSLTSSKFSQSSARQACTISEGAQSSFSHINLHHFVELHHHPDQTCSHSLHTTSEMPHHEESHALMVLWALTIG
jgi:hypothetical protein